jgi:hypothetical protein
MNHNVTIGIVAIVAAMALTGVAFGIPQQALAGGHHYRHNNHNSNSVKVDQQTNQLNQCTGVPLEWLTLDNTGSSTVCLNQADNSADIHR